MLNMLHYQKFTSDMRQLIDTANIAVAHLQRNWDDVVAADMNRMAGIAYAHGKPHLVNASDYPSADEIADRFSIDVRFMPIPKTEDFDPRMGISDDDRASLQRQLEDAETNASKHVLKQMLKPLEAAAQKLVVPIGQEGSLFRDSLVSNLVEVADRMNRVNISNDPVVQDRINDLTSLVSTYAKNIDVLRADPKVRTKAASQINSLVTQMSGLV